jgi:HD-GYP domain-containing protein (c-di-GMP phosphodiesterase class II)
LTREQMSVQARIMAVADIFEAVTAADRPYKRGNTLNEAVDILAGFKARNHIDPDLFDLFVRERIYEKYAEQFDASQPDRRGRPVAHSRPWRLKAQQPTQAGLC